MEVLLMGNPNVGKSAIFSKLTGVSVRTSNYAGTTVTFSEGEWKINLRNNNIPGCKNCKKKCDVYEQKIVNLIDVPGTYTLNSKVASEQVAIDKIKQADVIINVIDATNLERNLKLTLDIIRLKIPMIIVLNMWDETAHQGIKVDIEKMQELLKVPVIATSGRSGRGLFELTQKLNTAVVSDVCLPEKDGEWEYIGQIIDSVQTLTHRHHTFRDRLEEISMHPKFGLPIAFVVLFILFQIVTIGGEFLSGGMAYLFQTFYEPLMLNLNESLSSVPWLAEILVGNLIDGGIDFEASLGMLTSGIFIPIGLVMPYIIVFYLLVGFLEDFGYLPRLSVLLDHFFHRIGLHGYSAIPLILASGCNIPGVLALRNLETRREKFISAAIMCTVIPCIAQSAVVFQSVATRGIVYIYILIATLTMVGITMGIILNATTKGSTHPLISEIPPYRLPSVSMQIKKLWMRLKGFFLEAVPLILFGILIIRLLLMFDILEKIAWFAKPIITNILGLPKETISALLIGLIRKDAAVALLSTISLTDAQTIIAVVVLVLYFPCVATYTVLAKEVGLKDLLMITAIMLFTTLLVGSFLRLLLGLLNVYLVLAVIIIIILFAIVLTSKFENNNI